MIVRQDVPNQFLREACETVMRKRMHPVKPQKLEECLMQLQALMQQRKDEPSLYLQVSVQLRGRLESVKIEEWCFTVVSVRERTIQGLVSIQSSGELQELRTRAQQQRPPLCELTRMMSSKNISPIRFQPDILATDYRMTFDKQQLCALDTENTFEVVIDSFESRLHSFSINLMYNYELDQEEDDFVEIASEAVKNDLLAGKLRETPKHAATEAYDSVSPPSIRKFSEGLESITSHPSKKGSPIDFSKLGELRRRLTQIQFGRMDARSPQEMLDWTLK